MVFLPYLIMVPLGSAFLAPLFAKRLKIANDILLAASTLSLAALAIAAASCVNAQKIVIYKVGGFLPPAGITLVADGLSAFFLVTMNLVAFLIAVYLMGYVRIYTDTWKFYSLFFFMIAGINGVLLTGDIFNMYVFLEIAAISGYFLVAFGTGREELEAAFKYAVMGTVASIFILLGIAFLYAHASTLNLADLASALGPAGQMPHVVKFVTVLFLMGFGLKAALVPFHAWLPYAHSSAPAPISAMLSGISIKVLGIYALARILFNVFGITPAVSGVIITLGVASMIIGSILAFGQSDLKRLFAYSSISQIGYIALGLGLATPLGVLGALFHLFNHSIFKSLLFLNSGSIERLSGTRDINKISGIASAYPVTGYTNLAGSLSICGIPPLGGFWSKLLIILACVQAGRPSLALIAAAVSALTLAYYFRALGPVLFGRRLAGTEGRKRDISWMMALPMIILAVISAVSLFMIMPNPANLLLQNAVSVLLKGKDYAALVMGAIK